LEIDPNLYVDVSRPIRQSRGSLIRRHGIESAVELAARILSGNGGILILIDADDDCPAEMGPALLSRALATRPGIPMSVVLAKREFEAWFIAATESLGGYRGFPNGLIAPAAPEDIRDAKGWIEGRLGVNQYYVETYDQPRLAARFDLTTARRADSFEKCYRDVRRVIDTMRRSNV
jgi:hypothetical protein